MGGGEHRQSARSGRAAREAPTIGNMYSCNLNNGSANMKKEDVSSPPQAAAHTVVLDPAKAPNVVSTPSGTLSITLSPPQTPNVPLYQNVSLWVGLITFLGVLLTLIAAERRTKKELGASEERIRLERQFSSERAHQERITTTRRTVYLELIDELLKLQQFLGSLATSDNEPDFYSFGGLSGAVAKISLVGEMGTVIMGRELVMAANRTVSKAMPMAMQLKTQKQVVKYHADQCGAAQAELTDLFSAINNLEDDAAEPEKLRVAAEKVKARFERHQADGLAATNVLITLVQSYSNLILTEWTTLNHKLDELIHAIRTELGLETSLERLYQSTAEMQAAMVATTQELNTTMPATIQEMMTKGAISASTVEPG